MIHISWKNDKILKFWVLDFGFGLQIFFWPFEVFLRSLVSKKSSGMQKSYVWAKFHAKQFLLPIFHSGSLWLCQHEYGTECQQNWLFWTHPPRTFADVIYGWSHTIAGWYPTMGTLSFLVITWVSNVTQSSLSYDRERYNCNQIRLRRGKFYALFWALVAQTTWC
jgi:hypothetical protein